ncbi:lactococcin 972 family bacteriocin [Facklamia miroungae]|uniref:Bacteriocin, lactococcin 972 family n=1 Tax=Facklamia miroungae TaxID=120956 RepID=A0A1G7U3Y0_9LACT|nr:lactococcin 972 family bacteriocin [Facklamia miroungae]NKZ29908.1 lactococcin 972 family bacteriocin [Facklamia miroungae]SDG42345.1 bacteriocin, lactococcin 972 family [Facklamia miroungae]
MKKITKTILASSVLLLLPLTVVNAGISYKGGTWATGANHSFNNWGAFSNYFHPTRYHASSVASLKNGNSDYDEAVASVPSKAFINTSVGERVDFWAEAY